MKVTGKYYAYLWPGVTMSEMRIYGNNANTYLVSGALPGGRHVLVDPGMVVNETGQNCLERLIGEMGKDGFRVEEVGLVLNTHAHPDHYGASEEIRKRSGAQVAMGQGDDEFLKLGEGETGRIMRQMGFEMPPVHPDFYLTEGELKLGDSLVTQVFFTPGHSAGHLGFYWPDEKVFMGGDLIFTGSTGRVDIPGGDAHALRESIERVARLDIEYLLTGHQYGSPGILAGREEIAKNFDFVRKHIFPYLTSF